MFNNFVKFSLSQKKELFKDGITTFDLNDQNTKDYLHDNKSDIKMIDYKSFNLRD